MKKKAKIKFKIIWYIKNLFSRNESPKEIYELIQLDKQGLIQIKYKYIKEVKLNHNSGEFFKNITKTFTVIFTLITITIPLITQLINNSRMTLENAINQKIYIIQQQEIPNNEKVEKMEQTYTKLYNDDVISTLLGIEPTEKTINIIINYAIFIGIISFVLLLLSYRCHKKALYYEVLIQYIDEELLKT